MHHDKSVTLVVDNLVVLTALQSFHLLVLEHFADMLFHLSPQVVAIVENIWLVVAASIHGRTQEGGGGGSMPP